MLHAATVFHQKLISMCLHYGLHLPRDLGNQFFWVQPKSAFPRIRIPHIIFLGTPSRHRSAKTQPTFCITVNPRSAVTLSTRHRESRYNQSTFVVHCACSQRYIHALFISCLRETAAGGGFCIYKVHWL